MLGGNSIEDSIGLIEIYDFRNNCIYKWKKDVVFIWQIIYVILE